MVLLKHQATFKSLGSNTQIAIIKKYPGFSEQLIKNNPNIEIMIRMEDK